MMRGHFPSLTSLRAFEAAARLRSFKKAALELNVTATAISHRIRTLEETLARPLFVRKIRAVELTSDGTILFIAVRKGFACIQAGLAQLDKPRRSVVSLSVTPAFAAKWLVPRLASFQSEHPTIDLHVHASCEPVDLSHTHADLAIRYGQGKYAGISAVLLLKDRFAAVASPQLLAAQSPALEHWPLIHFDWQRALPVDLTWAAWARAANISLSDPSLGIHYSDESHAIQATVAGQGVALLSLLLIEEELRLGLLRIVGGPILQGLSYYLLQSNRPPVNEAVTAVAQWLIKTVRGDTNPIDP